MADETQLRDLEQRLGEVREFARRGNRTDWYINNAIRSGTSTEKSFTLFYLSSCTLQGIGAALDRADVEQAREHVQRELASQQTEIREAASSSSGSVGVLPNSYDSAVLVAGCLRAAAANKSALSDDTQSAISDAADWLAGRIVRPTGFIPSLYGGASQAPSTYLTFWCAAALKQCLDFGCVRDADAAKESLGLLLSWAGRRLRDMVAFHYGGLRPQFDVTETAYAAAALLMASDASDDRVLIQHAVSVLFGPYFKSGCLEPSAPVFTDATKMSVQISTAEVLATLFLSESLSGRTASASAPFIGLDCVRATYEWLRDHGDPEKGWYPEGQGRANLPNSFTTASALLVLSEYNEMLDDSLDHHVRLGLGVGPFVPNPKFASIAYPGDLDPLFEQTMFGPIDTGQRKIASYSVILYGPPGTSKTTVAQLISQRLKWPLLKLGPGSFMQKGRAAIDQQVAEVFAALRHLKRVVVLFDEVEELVSRREAAHASMESRLLTTAMLPRLQELRDQREVVFILATNRLDTIDSAITRLGRFDIVRCVLPPSKPARERMLSELVSDYKLSDEDRGCIEKLGVAEESERFCYGDLDAFVREIVVARTAGDSSKELIKRAFKHAQTRALGDDALKPYIESSEKFDRPGRREIRT